MNKILLFFVFIVGLFLLTGCSDEKLRGVDIEGSGNGSYIEDVGGLGDDLSDLEGLDNELNIDDLNSLDEDLNFDF